MARSLLECNILLQNITLPLECQTPRAVCCIRQCCYVNQQRKEVWQNWYFWLAVIVVCLLVLSSFVFYLAGSCKGRRHHLIRIRNVSTSASPCPGVGTTNEEGIIQPHLAYNKKQQSHALAIIESGGDSREIMGPLSPAYPAIQPVSIVRGSAPPLGYRQTSSYTELVLPPGYIDSQHNKS